jgi:hypothetical protein
LEPGVSPELPALRRMRAKNERGRRAGQLFQARSCSAMASRSNLNASDSNGALEKCPFVPQHLSTLNPTATSHVLCQLRDNHLPGTRQSKHDTWAKSLLPIYNEAMVESPCLDRQITVCDRDTRIEGTQGADSTFEDKAKAADAGSAWLAQTQPLEHQPPGICHTQKVSSACDSITSIVDIQNTKDDVVNLARSLIIDQAGRQEPSHGNGPHVHQHVEASTGTPLSKPSIVTNSLLNLQVWSAAQLSPAQMGCEAPSGLDWNGRVQLEHAQPRNACRDQRACNQMQQSGKHIIANRNSLTHLLKDASPSNAMRVVGEPESPRPSTFLEPTSQNCPEKHQVPSAASVTHTCMKAKAASVCEHQRQHQESVGKASSLHQVGFETNHRSGKEPMKVPDAAFATEALQTLSAHGLHNKLLQQQQTTAPHAMRKQKKPWMKRQKVL